jgi:hypothetical protein
LAALKTETLTVRLAPNVKAALRGAADREHRSLANMLEVMILDWCEANALGTSQGGAGAGSRHPGSAEGD